MSANTSTALWTNRWDLNSAANTTLKAAAALWFVVAVMGQCIFVFYIASFYGIASARGNIGVWNKTLAQGWMPGNTVGNTALAVHLLFAALITLSGALQLIPKIRSRVPIFHRWNGRFYGVVAFTMGLSGLYLLFSGRKVVGDFTQRISFGINGILILVCAALAWRYAVARDFKTHRRWALRLFLVVSGVWFFRVGLMFWLLLNKGPVGFDPATFQGPFITFLSFAQYLLPLGMLEIYLRTQDRAGAPGRFATGAGLFVLTLVMGLGIVGATMTMWAPRIRAAYDNRTSIADTLAATIASSGVDQAVKQYHDLKSAGLATYNFDENELNALGYQLIKANKFKEAIRIFQLNIEAYPQSANTYDSLGEAYMDDGSKAPAIANYQRSLQLNPKNHNAMKMIQKLNAQ
jgi:tetratricopeptide (TPR) repeat protein